MIHLQGHCCQECFYYMFKDGLSLNVKKDFSSWWTVESPSGITKGEWICKKSTHYSFLTLK